MDTVIGPAERREAEQILKLQYLCYQSEAALYDDYTIEPLTQSLHDLLATYDTHDILAARLGAEVVGSIRGQLIDNTCHIGRLMVHPRLQRHGLGIELVRTLEAQVAEADRFELFTGHRSTGNLRLYAQLGYTPFRDDAIAPHLRLIYLEKHRTAS